MPDEISAAPSAPSLTPEQVQLALRLESIFMPYARKQRDETYKRQTGLENAALNGPPVRFVHYTSAEAALQIINTKRIWMRNTTCMSDYREVQHGFEILNKFFSDEPKLKAFVTAVDSCVPGAAVAAIQRFNEWWRSIQLDTYIMSISEHSQNEDLHGRLSMWRAFGGAAVARVALVVKIPWFSGAAIALNLLFSPVAYLTEPEAHAVFQQVVSNVGDNKAFLSSMDPETITGTIFYMLLAAVTCLKHDGFREEQEWRAIYTPKFRPAPLMKSSIEVVGGVPQIVYNIPIDAKVSPSVAGLDLPKIFDRLIIGPSPFPWVMYEAFVEALGRAGVTGADKLVFVSGIPIRS